MSKNYRRISETAQWLRKSYAYDFFWFGNSTIIFCIIQVQWGVKMNYFPIYYSASIISFPLLILHSRLSGYTSLAKMRVRLIVRSFVTPYFGKCFMMYALRNKRNYINVTCCLRKVFWVKFLSDYYQSIFISQLVISY
jgi:hypothetical protein